MTKRHSFCTQNSNVITQKSLNLNSTWHDFCEYIFDTLA